MAHHSYLSPDGEWVLVVEMDSQGVIGPCRLAPFDGEGDARVVGPPDAACSSGAWSPDGKWIYVCANQGGKFHIWRQRFPDGTPEQVTSGPTEEEGIAMATDGKSFITSVGIRDSTVWVHDAEGEHQITSEGSTGSPQFSPDLRKLYYARSNTPSGGIELWASDLATGESKSVLTGYKLGICGLSFTTYALSHDGTRIAFAMEDKTGRSQVWIAPADRSSAPSTIKSQTNDDCPSFLPDGDLIIRATEGAQNYLYRVNPDGTGRRKVSDTPVFDPYGVSHDGRWALAVTRGPDEAHPYSLTAIPVSGGATVPVCLGLCVSKWDKIGKSLYINDHDAQHSYILPLQRNGLPALPRGGFSSDDLAKMKLVAAPTGVAESGGTPLLYAHTRITIRRNLYRIPLP